MNDRHQHLELLRTSLHRDIDEDSTSMIPPAAIIGMLTDDEDAAIEVYCITYGHLLRRLIRGMELDAVVGLGHSYLGMQMLGVHQQIADMRRVCGYADRILDGSLSRDEALAQMMTWKNADRRMIDGLLDETLDIYQREQRTSYAPPEDDFPLPDGDIRNDSFSTNAPHVRLEFRRLLRYDQEMRGMVRFLFVLVAIFAVLLAGDIALFATGHWIWGLLLAPLVWFSGKFAWMIRLLPQMKEGVSQLFQNALLTPGIIEKVDPLTILCLAPMSTGMGPPYWGVKRRRISALPFHTIRKGEVFPCVSGFQDGDATDHWSDFDARPIAWGTSDELKIKDLQMKLDAESAAHLQRLMRTGPLPKEPDKVLILDEHLAPLPQPA